MLTLKAANACFPSHVWEFELEHATAMQQGLSALVRRTLVADNLRAGGHASRLLQTGETLHRDSEARTAAAHVARCLSLTCELGVTSMWGNVYGAGALIAYHTHPNNYLTGVYYVEAEEGAGDLVFYDPRPQAFVIAPEPTQYNVLNAGRFFVTPSPGKLVLFPAWLPHSSRPNESGAERVSVSFNLALCGSYGVSKARTQGLPILDGTGDEWAARANVEVG